MSAPYVFNQFVVREDMIAALEEYVSDGVPLGGFLRAVVENDLKGACGRADGGNIGNLPAFVAYAYNEMPSTSHGSPEIYKRWLEQHAERRRNEAVK